MPKAQPPRDDIYRRRFLLRLEAAWALHPDWTIGRMLLHAATVNKLANGTDEEILQQMETTMKGTER